MRFVAVTSCPTGIAHTYMAAEALEQAARDAGHEIHVETQGATGAQPLTAQQIADADAVIYAADLEVRDKERFAGKPSTDVGVKGPIHDASAVLDAAVEAARTGSAPSAGEPSPEGGGGDGLDSTGVGEPPAASPETKVASGGGVGTRVRQWLMTGVSYMIPFVAAGGIMIALGFMVGGYEIADTDPSTVVEDFTLLSTQSWGALLFHTGSLTFEFLVPVLAGFIAFAIADRPGLVPGVLGGAVAIATEAGFLGGLVAGFLAGFLALGMSRIPVPAAVRGIMPVVVTPLVAAFGTGLVMFTVLGQPLASLMAVLSDWLGALSGGSLLLLGAVLGLMMSFDMGGPVNKAAYTFATAGITAAGATAQAGSTEFTIMAATMAGGMTPPLGLALATALRARLFSAAERQNGKAAWLLGASFITEGAIPFAAADPLRVIPALMAGSGTAGALVALSGSTLRAPHGGVWVTPLIGQPLLFLVAVAVGSAVTAAAVIGTKTLGHSREAAPASAAETV
ncbi:PTS system D-fructose-specific IIB component (F1P-forming) (Frc family) /PTS system D-fructose-specific IIC component (F1P-forming) (Frc family) [Haloactinospora alba]|uniref:PTS system D-fructose-specific IIB component (F1P-forming) (Frc family) /PTS system D-fructose-specific IIC component (F1P-forming) (Frc family) n=1 Tax=Haloactinospora alba TaxID=405555 RepID=A0A543NK61_9ACTN|nr:fructose-specific PTS transporter subunit EIIC [Haloactinospora alba]TQN32251.1 PTS system D-fructose-specific IIB component (F1P-forming) (Frc family) /PTS system D-fructose-specific IIC component (F1P-forming) (Frc family) [Haloactinospora alba]